MIAICIGRARFKNYFINNRIVFFIESGLVQLHQLREGFSRRTILMHNYGAFYFYKVAMEELKKLRIEFLGIAPLQDEEGG